MRRSASSQFIRGGQTTQHWWQMATQVTSSALKVGALVYLMVFIGLIFLNFRLEEVNEGYTYWIAHLNTDILNQPDFALTWETRDGVNHTETAAQVLANADLRAKYDAYAAEAELYYEVSFVPAIASGVLLIAYFVLVGNKLADTEHIRGSRLVSPKELKLWSERKWRSYLKKVPQKRSATRYTVAGIPFPPNTVEAQTGIFGTVGVGKTNAMKELLATIRAEGGRAIIYDKMGAFVRNYYNPDTDIILNMFDRRSVSWSPFHEADTPEAFAQIAEVMIQQRPGSNDPFWSTTARLVFEYAARSLMRQGMTSNQALRNAILTMPAEDLQALVQNTPGALFFGENIQKTSASIRANMIAELRFLEFLRDDGIAKFSMRNWVKEDRPGFVFLTGDAEHSAATRNVISTVIEVAANALMTGPERRDPSLWFFLDEVPSLNRLPFLPTKLAEIRQFGGAFVLGYQVFSQLEELYGDKAAQSIAGTLNNRIVFNTPDARTARLFSDSLGLADIIEHRETISFGADVTRDGNTLNAQRIERAIVTASEIQSLPQFKAYIRFGYDAPTALVEFPPIQTKDLAISIEKYEGDGFAIGSMDGPKPSGDGPREEWTDLLGDALADLKPFLMLSASEQLTEFETWFSKHLHPQFDRQSFELVQAAKVDDRPLAWECYATARIKGISDPAYRLIGLGARPWTVDANSAARAAPLRYEDMLDLAEKEGATAEVEPASPAKSPRKAKPKSPPQPAGPSTALLLLLED